MNTKINSDLHLMAVSGNFIHFYARQQHAQYVQIKADLLKDVPYCHFCGHIDNPRLHIVNKDFNYFKNKQDNLALACSLCAHAQMLDDPAWPFNKQHIIYLPLVSQARLNQLYHQWAQDLKNKKNIFEITEAISELISYTHQIQAVLNAKPVFQDLLGLFAMPYNHKDFIGGLRWVPSVDLLRSL